MGMGAGVGQRAVTGDADISFGDPVPRRPHSQVSPLRVTYYDDRWRTSARRVYGYRAECRCGYHGRKFKSYHEARGELHWHRATSHPTVKGS